ncbi:Ankyrin repeat-containing protein ITN1 [Camellia lanceoleosa]|uniref:Ankyrin repeat-containing protein ITN1 n=1 Tax=Camellia lanceoleosa TaxID=1840588 RepID=A0ACC0FIG2_9ERIC|nr:Ankyrin repeat-containing protein ITN1 [Camellia lanceoleosa]
MALPSTTQSWMNSTNIPNCGDDIPAAAERDISFYLPLHIAILQGNWENARIFFQNNPVAITARLTALSETPLLVAVKEKRGILFVRKLLRLMEPEGLALADYFGNTALHAVAVLGNIIEAKFIVHKSLDLPNIWNNDGFLPLHLAAMHGQRKMTLFLLSVTRDDEESKPYEGEAGATLMRFAIIVGFYDLALNCLGRNPKLAWKDFSPLEVMAQEHSAFPSGTCFNIWKCFIYTCVPLELIDPIQGNDQSQVPYHRRCCAPIFGVWQKFLVVLWKVLKTSVPPIKRIGQTKLMHHQAIQLVKRICREVIGLDNTKASSILRLPFLLAAQYGIHEIVKEILDSFPDAITFVDEENHTAFHLAVMYRHEKVFNVMHQRSGQYKLLISLSPDNDRNNMLHLVGYKARQQRLDFSSGAVLQMQRELQWFKVVEKFVLPQERKSKNCDGKTPLQIFIEEHKELMAYEGQWMTGMATSCTVAASLIAAVVFAAAITVPGGSTVDGFPNFSKKKAFMVFAISDVLALVSALSTVLSFLSIFTSRYAVIDYLHALPMRLIIGLLALFLSVITTMTAFSATLYLVFSKENALILIPIATLACLPVALFATLQLPPLLNMIKSTYGPSIFSQ